MKSNLPPGPQHKAFDAWYQKFPFVFRSEAEALRQMLPLNKNQRGMEICLGSGFFSEALGIKEGAESSPVLRLLAASRGLDVREGTAESLPYPDGVFDFALVAFCMDCLNDLHVAFGEAYRILKINGVLVIGFIDRNSPVGKELRQQKSAHPFYRQTNCYSVEKVVFELNLAGFRYLNFCQTLFQPLEEIKAPEPPIPGFGKGSFVVIQAGKAENRLANKKSH